MTRSWDTYLIFSSRCGDTCMPCLCDNSEFLSSGVRDNRSCGEGLFWTTRAFCRLVAVSYFVYLHFSWHFSAPCFLLPFLEHNIPQKKKTEAWLCWPPKAIFPLSLIITGRKGGWKTKDVALSIFAPGRSHCVSVPVYSLTFLGVSWKGPERSNSLCSPHSRDWHRFATRPVPFGTNRLLRVHCGLFFLVTGLFPGLCFFLQHVLRLVILCGPVRGAKVGQISLNTIWFLRLDVSLAAWWIIPALWSVSLMCFAYVYLQNWKKNRTEPFEW